MLRRDSVSVDKGGSLTNAMVALPLYACWCIISLGTLCVAYRTMSLSAWKSIQSEIDIAQTKVVERERLVSEIEAKKIEVNFTLLGCTAVEDKLQVKLTWCLFRSSSDLNYS